MKSKCEFTATDENSIHLGVIPWRNTDNLNVALNRTLAFTEKATSGAYHDGADICKSIALPDDHTLESLLKLRHSKTNKTDDITIYTPAQRLVMTACNEQVWNDIPALAKNMII